MNAIDTNVLVYQVEDTAGDKQIRAQQLADELAQSAEGTILLWQVAAEFLNCMRRWELAGRSTREKTIEYFEQLETLYDLILPARTVLHTALDLSTRHSLSHWDSLLVAACIEAGVTTLYSEDMADGADYDGVRIVNPFRQPAT